LFSSINLRRAIDDPVLSSIIRLSLKLSRKVLSRENIFNYSVETRVTEPAFTYLTNNE
jgi:hypothetical protein